MQRLITHIATIALLFTALHATAQQHSVEARIAGLEQNAEYMALLHEDAQLQQREDSIASAVMQFRKLLREQPENRAEYSRNIMQCENHIFEVRTAKGRIIDRINTIEQEWVLANLNADIARQEAGKSDQEELPDSLKRRNLIENRPFRQHLAAPDYMALRRAQREEMQAVDFVNRYLGNYLTLGELATSYATVATEQEALAIQHTIDSLQAANEHLSDSLARCWNYIYDNKSYAYDYLMEALRKESLLDRQQERLSATMREVGTLQGTTVSDALVDYFLRKRALVEYETDVAEELQLSTARDSLRGVARQLSTIEFKLPRIHVEERTFIEYDSVAFASKSPYTADNPIPECKVYQRGTIYRILLGTFATKRPVTIFRGTYPLSYQMTDEKKWRYFAGGFATLEEAEEAQARLKKRGFIRPEIVMWSDGEYRNLAEEPLPTATLAGYRIELIGITALPEEVRNAIFAAHETAQVSRIGSNRFIIGSFDTLTAAEKVAEAIRGESAALSPRIVEIQP